MTRSLILVRHAKSSWKFPNLDDHERPLNGRGRRSARQIGAWLRRKGHVPTRALSSDSARTRETWKLIESELKSGAGVNWYRALYHADAQTMLDTLRGSGDESTVMMLGHNPGIAAFASMLAMESPPHPRFRDYPTAATSIIDFGSSPWLDVDWGSGTVTDFTIPSELEV